MPSKRYLQRKADHLCVHCGKQDENTLAGRTYCNACTKAASLAKADKYQERIASQRCGLCGKQDRRTLQGYVTCEVCTKKKAATDRNRSPEARAAGRENSLNRYYWLRSLRRCGTCGKQDSYTLAGQSLCEMCMEKQRQRSRKPVVQYECYLCGEPTGNLNGLCNRCQSRRKAEIAKLMENGRETSF